MWLQMCDYTHVERDKVDGQIDDEEADGRASSLDSHPAQLHSPLPSPSSFSVSLRDFPTSFCLHAVSNSPRMSCTLRFLDLSVII